MKEDGWGRLLLNRIEEHRDIELNICSRKTQQNAYLRMHLDEQVRAK
jgi:hypothetical protein